MTVVMCALVLMASIPNAAADVTGKWAGTISGIPSDSGPRTEPALLILTQQDKTVAGSVGGNENDQHKITSGTIADSKVMIHAVTPNGREIRLELTVDGEEMKGPVFFGEQTAQLSVKRVK
jgi:hypothetical protein